MSPTEAFTVNGTVTSGNTSNTAASGTVTIVDNDGPAIILVTESGSFTASAGGFMPNVTLNDTINGLPIDITSTGNMVLSATGIWKAGITLDTATGVINVAPGIAPGVYTVEYTVCDKLTPKSCASIIDQITITPVIDPRKEDFIIPSTGGSTTSIVLNDNVNGFPADISATGNAVIAASGTWPTGITLDPLTGIITVKPGTIPGVYAVDYSLCDKLTPQSCATMTDQITIGFVAAPSISLIKNANFNNENGDSYAQQGETITYNFIITNTGNVPLTNVTITDLLPGIVLNGSPIPILNVGASNNTSYSAVYTITKADITNGSLTNDAAVSGSDQNGNAIRNTAIVVTPLDEEPAVLPDGTVKIYNAVSPNDDGKNDFFRIDGIELYPENTLEIYNRWGILVYERKGYNNVDNTFKGMSDGRVTVNQFELLPTGTYYYVLKYIDNKAVGREKAGYLYLNR